MLEFADVRAQIGVNQVVAQVHDEIIVADIGFGDFHGVGEACGGILQDKTQLGIRLFSRPLAQRDFNALARLGADDDVEISHAALVEAVHGVMQDGFVGHGNQLLGHRVGEGTQAGALATGKNQRFYRFCRFCRLCGHGPPTPFMKSQTARQ